MGNYILGAPFRHAFSYPDSVKSVFNFSYLSFQEFEGLIDRKIREIGTLTPTPPVSAAGESPFLSTKEIQKIFNVSRQTINDWRKSGLLPSIKIKSRRYFFRDQVQSLQQKWIATGNQ